jgi:hypothetical protein
VDYLAGDRRFPASRRVALSLHRAVVTPLGHPIVDGELATAVATYSPRHLRFYLLPPALSGQIKRRRRSLL